MHLTVSLWLRSPFTALLFLALRLQSLLPRPLRCLGKKRGRRRYSVVTAVYNAERWLPAYFTSLLCQTLDPESCLEILCIDDGSTDGSVNEILRWQKRYPGLIRLLQKENGGPASARNPGIDAATGEWITFIDADDFVHPGYFAAVEDFLNQRAPRPLGMVVCRYLMYKQSNGVYKDSHPLRQRFHTGEQRIPANDTGTFVQVVCNSAFFLRQVFLETGIRQKEDVRPTFEDGEMVMRYVTAIAARVPCMDIGVLPRAKYYHRRTSEPSSLTQRAYREAAYFDAPLALGSLRLLRELHAEQGRVPLFVQMTILWNLFSYMRRIFEGDTFAVLDENVRRRFFTLASEVVSFIDESTIQTARYTGTLPFSVPLVFSAYKGRELSPHRVFLERHAPGDSSIGVFYHSRARKSELLFFFNTHEIKPASAVAVKLPDWDGHILYEHRLKLPLTSKNGTLHTPPGEAEFFAASGGTGLGGAFAVREAEVGYRLRKAFSLSGGFAKLLFLCTRLARNMLLKNDPLFEGCDGSCPHILLPAAERIDGPLEPAFPVDMVYAWVDGSDPALAAKKAAHLPPGKQREAASHGLALHRDNDELRYSLRALEAYAPWAHRIFIVTDAQIPLWLDTSHPKIHIVDHLDFIPPEYLPTFSSRIIEAFLPRIPGLGEYYIYCNDDFFLAAPCRKGFFFTANGLPRIFTDWRSSRRRGFENPKSPHTYAYNNALRCLAEHGIFPDPTVVVAHAPYAQTRSLAGEAHRVYKDAISRFAHNKFRTREDLCLPTQAIPLFACATKRAVPCDVPHYYINIKRFDHQAHYDALLRQKGKPCQPPFFCLNDVGSSLRNKAWQRDMAAFLQAYYPEPSSFEKRGC